MEYRYLGRTGLKVSELCLGSMQFGWTANEEESHRILSTAFETGINFIDTADVYSRWVEGNPGGVSETIIGNWLRNNGIPRNQVIIATKVRSRIGEGPNDEGLSRVHIFDAVEGSLRRLKTDYIDLYQTHWFDERTPLEETLGALNDLVHQGKVRMIGCSNYPAWRVTEALWISEYYSFKRFETLQPHYNLVHRAEFERELRDVCSNYQLGVIPYSPLAAGFLTGKYRLQQVVQSDRARGASRHFSDRNWAVLDLLGRLGKERGGRSTSQMALGWLLADPLITSPIIGPRTLEQLADNLGATGLRLSEEEKKLLDEASSWKTD